MLQETLITEKRPLTSSTRITREPSVMGKMVTKYPIEKPGEGINLTGGHLFLVYPD